MNYYNYLDGLEMLHELKIDLNLEKIGNFRKNFEKFYYYRLGMAEPFDDKTLLSITECAYSSINSGDLVIDKELRNEFFKKLKSSGLVQKLKNEMNRKVIISTMN